MKIGQAVGISDNINALIKVIKEVATPEERANLNATWHLLDGKVNADPRRIRELKRIHCFLLAKRHNEREQA